MVERSRKMGMTRLSILHTYSNSFGNSLYQQSFLVTTLMRCIGADIVERLHVRA